MLLVLPSAASQLYYSLVNLAVLVAWTQRPVWFGCFGTAGCGIKVALEGGKPMGGATVSCGCCGDSGVRIIMVDGDQVGIIGLDETLAQVRSLGLTDEERIKEELLERVKRQNYVPPGQEPYYREALWREYVKKARSR